MNQCEMMFEIEMTPNRFREIAAELEALAKSDLFTRGQVIRYKFNSKFAFIYRPDTKHTVRVMDTKESFDHFHLNDLPSGKDHTHSPSV